MESEDGTRSRSSDTDDQHSVDYAGTTIEKTKIFRLCWLPLSLASKLSLSSLSLPPSLHPRARARTHTHTNTHTHTHTLSLSLSLSLSQASETAAKWQIMREEKERGARERFELKLEGEQLRKEVHSLCRMCSQYRICFLSRMCSSYGMCSLCRMCS